MPKRTSATLIIYSTSLTKDRQRGGKKITTSSYRRCEISRKKRVIKNVPFNSNSEKASTGRKSHPNR